MNAAHIGAGRCAARLALSLFLGLLAAVAEAQPIQNALDETARGGAWPRALLLDTARAAAGVDAAWPRTPLLGAGASVCVVDTGVDLEHAAFRDEAGRSRARWVLDLARAPLGLHPELEARFGGAVLDRDDVEARLGTGDPSLADPHGHGTAIAGAALGDDATIDPRPGSFAGVAPRSALVVVRALRPGLGGLLDGDVIAGARFCAEVLDRASSVLLFALGGHDGAHDGSEPLEAALRALAVEGWTIVVAAGNEGARALHAGGTVSPGREAAIDLFVPDPGPRAAHLVVSVRGHGALALEAPDGARTDAVPGARLDRGAVTIDARSPRARYVVLLGTAEAPLRGGTYRLRFSGDVDAWITDHDLDGLVGPRFEGPFAQAAETIAIPATEPSVIAVGALVSRAAWASETGAAGLVVEPEELTRRAPFSARGPAASGWARPDLLAPGALVRTVLSGSIETGPDRLFPDASSLDRFRRGEGVVLAGTSVSAAIVAGAVALARAEAPGLDPEAERAALVVSASDPLGSGDPATLALDVAAYLEARRARGTLPSATRSSLALSRSAVRPGLSAVSATVLIRDAAGRPTDGEVELRTAGRVLARGTSTGGLYRALLPPLAGDVGTELAIDARIGGVVLSAPLRLAPDERGARVRPVGGCQASPRTGVPRGAAVLAPALLVGARLLRRRQQPFASRLSATR
jgi:subtilisin family serine protease